MDFAKPQKKKQKAITSAMQATRVEKYGRKHAGTTTATKVYWESQKHGHAGRLINASTISPFNRLMENETLNWWRLILGAQGEMSDEELGGRCPLCELPLRGDRYHAIGCSHKDVATNQNRHALVLKALRVQFGKHRPDLAPAESEPHLDSYYTKNPESLNAGKQQTDARADLLMTGADGDECLLDLTIGHVFSQDVRSETDIKVDMLYKGKMTKYRKGHLVDNSNNRFLPAAIDSVGRIEREFEDYLREAASDPLGRDKDFFNKTVSAMMLAIAKDNNKRIIKFELLCEAWKNSKEIEKEARKKSAGEDDEREEVDMRDEDQSASDDDDDEEENEQGEEEEERREDKRGEDHRPRKVVNKVSHSGGEMSTR